MGVLDMSLQLSTGGAILSTLGAGVVPGAPAQLGAGLLIPLPQGGGHQVVVLPDGGLPLGDGLLEGGEEEVLEVSDDPDDPSKSSVSLHL